MIRLVIFVLIFIGIIYGFSKLTVTPKNFVLFVKDGQVFVNQGQLPQEFINDCSDIAQNLGIVSGQISGVNKPHGMTLMFSSDVPQESHQRFRNVFSVHRAKIKKVV